MNLGSDATSLFIHKTAIINQVAMAKFFHIICKELLLSLFASGCRYRDLLEPVSIYFGTVKINGCGILHLHCLVWLKKALYLPTLCIKIEDNKDFCIRLWVFLEHIIKCSANNDDHFNALHHACSDSCEANSTKNFKAQLKKNSKAIAKKV